MQDLRYALRTLRRSPGFAAIAVLTLALGIGVNTAVFSVIHAVLLSPLPYDHPEQLSIIWSSFQKMGASRAPASGVELREIRDRSRTLKDVAGIWVGNGTFSGDDPEQVKVGFVTANFFAVLGAQPALGRSFLPEEEGTGSRHSVILSDGLWRRRFGADPRIIGRAVRFEGGNFTVAGVMPRDFQLIFPADASVPLNTQAWTPFPYSIYATPRDLYFLRPIARLMPGVRLDRAQQDADSIAQQLRSQFNEFGSEKVKLEIAPLVRDAVRDIRPALLALFAGAGFVLLIACVNVANLLLSRANGRRKEIAVRVSLGAPKRKIIRQLLTESLVLCCLGGAAGLLIGWWGNELLLNLKPDSLARIHAAKLNLPVLAFASAISLGAAILFGLVPALQATKLNLSDTLREAGRRTATSGGQRIRAALVVSEISLGFVLLVGAGLMIRTLVHLLQVDPGFRPAHVLTFEIELPFARYPRDVDRINFVTRWEQKLSALPGVESAGSVSHLPLDDYPNWYSPYTPQGLTEAESHNLLADHRTVTPGYLRSIGAHLVSGREFDALDQTSARNVVIIDDLLARTSWPGENPVGKKIKVEHYRYGDFHEDWSEIVGVVRHIRHHNLSTELRGQVYIPYPQSPRTHMSYVIRASGDALALGAPIRRELKQIDPELALSKLRPMQDYVSRAAAPASFVATLAGIFATLALVLAAIGIYGLLSYSVSQRTHEFGVRMALGASGGDLLRLVMREGFLLAGIGMALGIAGSLGLSQYLRGLLAGVTGSDPLTYIAAVAIVPLTVLAASWKPARAAAAQSPMQAIGSE